MFSKRWFVEKLSSIFVNAFCSEIFLNLIDPINNSISKHKAVYINPLFVNQ